MPTPTTASLQDSWARLARADQLLSRLESDLQAWFSAEGFDLSIRAEGDGWRRVRFARVPVPPAELALTLAEMLNNLRSALDYLAWQLVLLSAGTPNKTTSFPIVERQADWAKISSLGLRGMKPKYVSRIENLQPYHTAKPMEDPLLYLRRVDNKNKHQFLARAVLNRAQAVISVEWKRPPPKNASLTVSKPRKPELRDGAVILAVRPHPSDLKMALLVGSVKAGISFHTDIDSPRDFPNVNLAVRQVLEQFDGDFQSAVDRPTRSSDVAKIAEKCE